MLSQISEFVTEIKLKIVPEAHANLFILFWQQVFHLQLRVSYRLTTKSLNYRLFNNQTFETTL